MSRIQYVYCRNEMMRGWLRGQEGGVGKEKERWGLDSGLVVVLFITAVYVCLVFGLFFYVKNEWCYELLKDL